VLDGPVKQLMICNGHRRYRSLGSHRARELFAVGPGAGRGA
jgi:hypothetical protein